MGDITDNLKLDSIEPTDWTPIQSMIKVIRQECPRSRN